MRLNHRAMMKREAFFLKTGKLSRRRNVLRHTRHRHQAWRNTRPVLKPENPVNPDLAITGIKSEATLSTLRAGQLELAVETPASDTLGALRN